MKSVCKFVFVLLVLLLPIFSFAAAEKPKEKVSTTSELKITVEKDWLLLPMNGSEKYHDTQLVDESGKVFFSTSTLITSGTPKWRAPVNVANYKGGEVVLRCSNLEGTPSIFQTDNPTWTKAFTNRARPLFHLTAKEGVMGAPVGMFFFKGKWHAFYLWNPFVMNIRPPYFVAHATSDDLTSWTYEKPLFIPKFEGDSFVSPMGGSAWVDSRDNSIVFAWRFSDGSLKLGRSTDLENINFFANIPALFGGDSIPNIFFNEDNKTWVIVLAKDKKVLFFVSADFKDWNLAGEFESDFMTPSLVRVPYSEKPATHILFDGDGRYLIGNFDGSNFKPVSGKNDARQIFFGNIFCSQFWRNAPDNRLLASTMVYQPGDLLREVEQSFTNTMSLPYPIRLASTTSGERLRASVLPEMVEYFGKASDALGVESMNFRSNVFSLPDAVGNYYALVFTLNTSGLDIFTIGAGVSRFEYHKNSNSFLFKRIEDTLLAQPYKDNFRDGFIDIMMFVDSYDFEAIFLNGIAVLFYGDSFINPEQEIKFGGKGDVYLHKVSRIPILSTTQAQRGKMASRYLESLKRETEEKAKEKESE